VLFEERYSLTLNLTTENSVSAIPGSILLTRMFLPSKSALPLGDDDDDDDDDNRMVNNYPAFLRRTD